ncbi:hypothetical protein HAX54_029981, partial [Datura stramonium]|nr:hypothetical protein [Datura stramonium]
LEQGFMTIREYNLQFTPLAKYAMYMIPTKKQKLRRFMRGLEPHVKVASATTAVRSTTCTSRHYWVLLKNKRTKKSKAN